MQESWGPLLPVDDAARDDLHRYAVGSPGFVHAMKVSSTLGISVPYAVVFVVLIAWLLVRRLRRRALFAVVTVVGGGLLNTVVKTVVDRARPVLPDPEAHASYSSFPSGPAQGVAAACTAAFGAWRQERGRPPVDAGEGLEPEARPTLRQR